MADSSKEPFRLFAQNWTGFGSGPFGSAEQGPLPPPPPTVEVLLSEASGSSESTMEHVNFPGGFHLLKGRANTYDVFGVSNSDLVPGKYEGGLKLWEGSLDLVRALNSDIRDGQLSLIGKRVLELGCGHGLPGIFSCLEGAAVVHFQDFNAEVLRCLTIPNVNANLSNGLLETNAFKSGTVKLRFFAGDWSQVHRVLFPEHQNDPGMTSSKNHLVDGYDVILMAETVYSLDSLQNLYELIKKCLRHPDGVVYLAAKKHYFGVGGGTRQFKSVVEEDGVMKACLLAEVADGSSNVREVWKFSY